MTYFDGRHFTPDDYRLLERVLTDWIADGFSSDEATLAHADALRDWMRRGLAEHEQGHR